MPVKRKKVDNQVERRLATGMIVSTRVLREISSIYKPELVEIPYVRKIVDWCMQYHSRYSKAPGQHIQDIYNSHVRKGMDDDEADLIGDLLEEISSEYERADKFNAQYLLDEVEERFKSMSLSNLAEDIQAELSNGNVMEAETLLGQYNRVARPSSDGINPLDNAEIVQEAFESRAEPLFTLPGEVGRMLNPQLVRGSLLGIMGKAKIGKTALILELAVRALRARCNVAVFEVGDETQEDMTVRLHVRLAGRSNLRQYCGKMWVPVLDCIKNQEDTCTSKDRESSVGLEGATSMEDAPKKYKPCSYCTKPHPHRFRGTVWYERQEAVKPLSWREGLKIGQRFMKRLRGRNFKLFTYPSDTINVAGIRAQLDNLEHFEGWVPDVILIDYADILAPEPESRGKETRDQQNTTWKALRKLSQERHCFVGVPTQSDTPSYDVFRLKAKHFSEDRRKNDHVTAMAGLNQTEEEKRQGLLRMNWVLVRHGDFDSAEMIVLLQCLQKGRPLLGSFRYRPKKKKKETNKT